MPRSALFCLGILLSSTMLHAAAPKRERALHLESLHGHALLDAARAESDASLHHLALAKSLHEAPRGLDRTGRMELLREVRDPARGLLPQKPLLPKKGPIEVRYYVGKEFIETEIALLSHHGFDIDRESRPIVASRGRLHVVIREASRGVVLEDLADPKVHAIVYSGHSDLGGIVESALATNAGKTAKGTKLIALFQCTGVQTLALLKQRAPLAHVLATFSYSFTSADEIGVEVLLDGLEHGHRYDRIRNALKKRIGRADTANYLFPDQVATLDHLDLDKNGQLDDPEHSDAPWGAVTLDREQRQGAARMMSGVHFLRATNRYYAEQTPSAIFTREASRTPIVAAGIVDGDGKSVTQIREVQDPAGPRIEVALDAKFATSSRTFIGAATVFEVQNHLQRRLAPSTADDPTRVLARSLGFAADYLRRTAVDDDAAAAAFAKLATMHGVPASISYARVRWTLVGPHVLEEKQVDRIVRLLKEP